ncbi:MAG: hemerythrin domain-containing protein [Elusimicrobia bacterium]|nr:hemerythrin domain-containing protein [Elusimicrobiota bacterium]
MDIIEVFLEKHGVLRRELAALEAPFQRPHGVGWDDCVSLDCKRLLKEIEAFFADFREHEAAEDEFMSGVSSLVKPDAATSAAFERGRRAVADIMKLFGAVAFTFDGEHVHRVRELLSRMRAEVEEHLAFEEKSLFPMLRERVPEGVLRESGERALHGHAAG